MLKTKPKKKAIKKKTRKNCVEIAKKIAKARDKRCVRCGAGPMNAQMQGSHIKGEGAYPNLSYNPRNIKCLCASCHFWWHSVPTESGHWFRTKFPEWHDEIVGMTREPVGQQDYNAIYKNLCEQLKLLS